MELHINTYGSALRKKTKCLRYGLRGEKENIPAKISSIVISNAVQITSDAPLALEHNIDVVMHQYGDPYARVWFPRIGSTVLIRRRQLEMIDDALV